MKASADYRREFRLRGALARFRESGRTQIHPLLARPNWYLRFGIAVPFALLAIWMRYF